MANKTPQNAQHGDIIELKSDGQLYGVWQSSNGDLRIGSLDGKFHTDYLPFNPWLYRVIFRTRQTLQ